MKKSKKKSSLPKGLPDCTLLNTLSKRQNEYSERPFDFVATLDEFRKSVSQVIRNINILFPEYTPHDEEYHLKRLFSVADIFLGDILIESMTLVELFVLSCALYGHDWGMAVSEKEKECILKRIPVPVDAEFYLLEDEFTRLNNFKKENGVNPSQIELPIELWRDYVRLTHADRSAERIKKYFEKYDRSLSEAIARVCEGHCLPFEAIQDQNAYPPNYSTLKESINLRAITIYLRLIDYFDLSDDRTPYLLWKYVSPRDPMSIKEWNKHRSLNHITSFPYQNGRIIIVDGSTNNYEVYASLMDLKDSIENEFRQCMDALAYMNDKTHKLDIYKIQWRVRSIGFKPIEIKFEFLRERMFEILSKEIYQGDPYVFLRELLQNSIDAIRFRKGILKRNGIETNNIGKIEVKSELLPTGDYLITWSDDGIGMDEYIVKNYLSMAGKSFYRSNDFVVENVQMDPISRYGIGILSCFMVADSLEITTKREPYLCNSNALRIYIPAIDKQFRIEEKKDLYHVGTTIKLYISKNKLIKSLKDGNCLQVTKYLEEIAGFVEYPILVKEGENKSIIAHPKADDNDLKKIWPRVFYKKKYR